VALVGLEDRSTSADYSYKVEDESPWDPWGWWKYGWDE